MERRKVRIGIDVGGTFTDAIVIDNDTYEIIGKEKIPTTHNFGGGVAKGIIDILNKIMKKNDILPEDVVFIAHGTTQATNSLLEGDVSEVGVLAMGNGMESVKVKNDTNVGDIELAPNKYLKVHHEFVDSNDFASKKYELNKALELLKNKGAEVIVASESFSVDDPSNEINIMNMANERGLYATGGHEVSQLYGLKVRTRTAVVNGSLIPKMMETANMTENCVKESGIKSPLMIMRCDGGVMTTEEVRKRPILTMLSGLAAGVAGALMYEKVSDGIFFEAGGTSTDISVIKNGKVMIKYAQVGGHKTYLNSLDVRTLGIAGGSMIKMEKGKIIDVGPRSAHIAGVGYEVFNETSAISNPVLKTIAPMKSDNENYVIIECENNNKYALTLCGAANILDMISDGEYSKGNKEAAVKAWAPLAKAVGLTVKETAEIVMEIAIGKIKSIVDELITEYELTSNLVNLVGGGGSAAVVVPYLGKITGYKWTIAKNASYISTIGVALAMVREVVERTVLNPTNEDIASIRREAFDKVLKSGANDNTVEISIEIDKQANILRAIATGATEFRTKDLTLKKLSKEQLINIAAKSMVISDKNVKLIAEVGKWNIFRGLKIERKFIFKKKNIPLCVLDREGVVRIQKNFGEALVTRKVDILNDISKFIDDNTDFSDAGGKLPLVYVFYGEKQLDLSGLVEKSQIISLVEMEICKLTENEPIAIVVAK
ncbi:hydantoinase/oxoprolinase family protein [Clostridium perfringens]|nr:hydantoinase/oxoprolinase family protein [Clostridium perfringens]